MFALGLSLAFIYLFNEITETSPFKHIYLFTFCFSVLPVLWISCLMFEYNIMSGTLNCLCVSVRCVKQINI